MPSALRARLAALALALVAVLQWYLFVEVLAVAVAWGACAALRASPVATAVAVATTAALRSQSMLAVAVHVPPWAPTPHEDMALLMELGGARANLTFVELGSGDGRNLLLAAGQYSMRAVGLEANPLLAQLARLRARWYGLGARVTVLTRDFDAAPLPPADLIYTYLSVEAMQRLAPALRCARTPADGDADADTLGPRIDRASASSAGRRRGGGARVLSRDFELPGARAARTERRAHASLYVYDVERDEGCG